MERIQNFDEEAHLKPVIWRYDGEPRDAYSILVGRLI
jgi:hypothetical protein